MTDKQLFTRKLKIIQSLIDNLQRKDDIFSQIIYLRQFKEQLGINYKDIINKVNNIYIYMVDDLGMHTNDISILNNQDANKLVLKQFENGNGNNDLVNSFYDKKDLKDSSFILFDNKQNTFSFGSDVIHILPLIKTYIDAMNHFLSTHKQIVLPNEILK
ncbi:hypothetical protein [Apilactobacillus micheneri]|uniref:hypothetical protein n=2 Tax=Apilactobacillus TaxID=2767877 RepID=UPI00112B1152|nr:hypothetical protein [Apilactobacillus micheneri]TPR50767.1 hypothetical protein DY126_06880 [Apilactobacillus micheneri]